MIWQAIQRRFLPYLSPVWLEAWRVNRARRDRATTHPMVASCRRRLFVDVSVISRHDAGTGIQRVVRAVASGLLATSANNWDIQLVAATRKRSYHQISWLDAADNDALVAIKARPGDVFLGLDFALDTIRIHRQQLSAFRRQGGQLWFLMYDLLPCRRSEWFSDKLVVRYRKWLGILAALADGFFCISLPVEAELREELSKRYRLHNGYHTHVLPMGGDLDASYPSTGLPIGFDDLLQRLSQRPTALMVGTLEPRKGHADILAAFDLLWRRGVDAVLVIAGRPGWHTEKLQLALSCHLQYGERLYWLQDASDEALERLYGICHGVIAASYAEGFGLPIIEALGQNKPVLARDIPVFRLQEDKGVRYFAEDSDTQMLADAIEKWFASEKDASSRSPIAIANWADTATSILTVLSVEHP